MNKIIEKISTLFLESGKKKIAIIGKGPSLDELKKNALDDFFIININDSERIIDGNVCLYIHEWVKKYLLLNKVRCDYYLTADPIENDARFISVDYIPESPENYKPIQERFFDPGFELEDALIISAIKLSNLIADRIRQRISVYLLGFDFSIKNGFSTDAHRNIDFGENDYLENLLQSQQEYLSLLMNHKSELAIELIHVGNKHFSGISIVGFNRSFSKKENITTTSVKIKDTNIDEQSIRIIENHFNSKSKVEIVAEITTNHFGNLDLLQRMIAAAAEAGADSIKLQKRDVNTFYTAEELAKPYNSPFGKTFRDYRNGLELNEDGFNKVIQWCSEYGIKWFASVLDKYSYEFIKQFSPEKIKLPSTISEHEDFLKYVASEFKGDVVISTGMTSPEYETFIINEFKNCSNIYLLQCTSSYPTMNEDANVAVVRHYHDLSLEHPKIIPGYSSHDIGSLCCQLAVASGGLMIEKHVKYGNTPWAHFDNVAIDMLTDKFKVFVQDIRLAEACLGDGHKRVLRSEHHKYRK
ncbi:N-acetylneuraminate synthase [Buttiauxella noackiae ATCC 51607]|uniref:N-acetylneuraminate synthase n=1 Tax=Buttiauxella noackiae ATCC 51607 TaxID=1354255 RepID=A0A1B7HPD0_9ENTR|nr:N-acetylneuraminate synthase family protein [Buttiauxella noackiae]OAT17491.1 N-acetylneuraminate synthase [Buttiauxella noackiae ATCC 51607]